ncbi:long-chain-fatty-acid--CoA ligase [Marinobacter zhanjiangensis]|uniref:Dicarboxylate--CoA ligase PimA n=1 Tax=Marinobacter zhanjiangensis TaxID=578215 RepID=A0ABQ3AXL0_9GAMM|nr:long-chain fatty acid--CoA ligase [Marinobacter zhanjiangensis]GGY71021.1 dicarboxylate--CoA ligase PimA [Marinobacter zhanjiangensis]
MTKSVVAPDSPWFSSYPPEVPQQPELTGLSVHQMLTDSASRWPDRAAVNFMGRELSYPELDQLVSRAAAGFQKLGVGPGVHVGLYLPNSPHGIIGFLGVLRAGGVVVNYSPLDAERILEHKIGDSETDIMVTVDLKALLPNMTGFLGTSRLQKLVVGSVDEFALQADAVRSQLDQAGELAAVPDDDRVMSFADLLNNDGNYQRHAEAEDLDGLAVLQYTGGTTGAPKGAMLTHGNIACAADQLGTALKSTVASGEERVLAVLPPFHIYSIVVNMLFGLRNGATLYLHMKFDPKQALETVQREKITVFPAVPTMLSALLAIPGLKEYELDSLKLCNSGGAPLPVELQQRFQDAASCSVKEGWGMTETAALGTFTPEGMVSPDGACGLPVPGVDLKIIDLDGSDREMPQGERGELCIAGPNVMKGYWKRDDATAESMTANGYFRTGDVAWMDEKGFFYIVDRTKDMIICSGYNVYPRNIEEAVYEHPSVAEVSVIGVPDDYRGQSPRAYITLQEGQPEPTLDEMKAFLKPRLGKHEMIHSMEIRDELPKTQVGKLSKKELYAEVRR